YRRRHDRRIGLRAAAGTGRAWLFGEQTDTRCAGNIQIARTCPVMADPPVDPFEARPMNDFGLGPAVIGNGQTGALRDLFVASLRHRNRYGLLAEDIHPETGQLWGN